MLTIERTSSTSLPGQSPVCIAPYLNDEAKRVSASKALWTVARILFGLLDLGFLHQKHLLLS